MAYGSGRADMVAVKDGILHVFECKCSFSIKLLEQCYDWVRTKAVNRVSLCVPYSCRSTFSMEVARRFDLGIHFWMRQGTILPEVLAPQLPTVDSKVQKMLASLHPDMKNFAPGTTADKGFSTPYNRTIGRVKEFVRQNPKCGLTDILANVEHHYASKSSARTSLGIALTRFDSESFLAEKVKGQFQFTLRG